MKKNRKLPAVVFLNVAGRVPGRPSVKSNPGNITWARLVATQELIGITIEVDGEKVHESFDALFKFLAAEGDKYNIDTDRLGVWAASANTVLSSSYLMKNDIYKEIKAAVLYYGFFPTGPIRKDLPLLFMIAEGDVERNEYQNILTEVLKNKAPWTIKVASNMPHAFDVFSDNDESRILIKETLSFWKNNLEPIPQPDWKKSPEREIVEAQYWRDDKKIVSMMKDWFTNNPASTDLYAYQAYARALLNTGNYSEAEVIHKKRLELEPSNNAILIDLVIASNALGKHVEADDYLKQYSKNSPLQRSTYSSIGFPLLQIKKYKEAVQYYEKAVAIEARPATYYVIACCYAQTNEIDKAFEALNKAAAAGYGTKQQYEKEEELEPLKKDARWKMLIDNVK